jgi:membrane protease YdiL (CAAX protease family)
VLNGIIGVAAGYLFWRYGLEAAMIAHFCGDMMLHVVPVLFQRDQPLTTARQIS